ncbi:MAG: hypothetical protein KGZ73_05155 [Rhizobiales bacterium]|nr:hypothetical protein [Hyphomicrobiales bacterium]
MQTEQELHEEYMKRLMEANDAENEMREAMKRAIDAKIAMLMAQIKILETKESVWKKAASKEIKVLYERVRFLGGNRDRYLSNFTREPLDDSWRKRVIGI